MLESDFISKTIDFIREEFNSSDFIPLHEPRLDGNEKKYINECIDSTFVSSVGKFVDLFEVKIAEFVGAKKAVVCVNGTNALHLGLKVVGVEPNDEVLTQPLTFIATINAISYANAIPIFIDVDKETMGLSPKSLKLFLAENAQVVNGQCFNKISGNRIKACMPMHTFGHACKIEEIKDICDEYFIEIVEDAAEALGSYYKKKHLGTFGKIGVISFNGNKIMTTGGGGVLITNDEKLAERAKHLSMQSKVPSKWEYRHDSIGYNYRMPNINAALGLAQLEQMPKFIESKRKLAEKYSSFFKTSKVSFFHDCTDEKSNYWLNAVIFNNLEERNHFLEVTNNNGIMTRPIWQLANTMSMFKNCQKADLSNATWLEERVVNIPSSVR